MQRDRENLKRAILRKRTALFFVIPVLFFVVHAQYAEAKTAAPANPPHKYLRIFYYQEGKNARASFQQHINSIDVLAPQAYFFDGFGELQGGVKPSLLTLAKKYHVRVMPLVTNGAFSQRSFQTILENSAKQDVAIAELVALAQKQKFWGWQIDFEQMDVSYRDKFSAFVQKFGVALKKENLTSSVAVIGQVSENPNDYPNDLWRRIIGVYDYAALASSTDFLSVMSYDDPSSTGPIAGYTWLNRVLVHSLSMVPNEKLSLGLPFYYWQWDLHSGKRVGIGGYEGINNVLKKYSVIKGYDKVEQAPYMRYATKKGTFIIWYENAESIKKKIELVTQYKLSGFSAWSLGLEQASVYQAMKR